MYKFTVTLMILAFVSLVSACSTVEGVGKDIQQVGTSIENKAKKDNKSSAY